MAKFQSIAHFKDKVKDIARPYQFQVFFGKSGSFEVFDNDNITAHIRTATLPGVTINPVAINYFGMTYNIAGTPTYEAISCTFIIDAEYNILSNFHESLDVIFKYNEGPEWKAPEQYIGDMTIIGQGIGHDYKYGYVLKNAWLSGISGVSFGQDNKDQPLTFDATITYSHYLHSEKQ